jgi:hypothetical protein
MAEPRVERGFPALRLYVNTLSPEADAHPAPPCLSPPTLILGINTRQFHSEPGTRKLKERVGLSEHLLSRDGWSIELIEACLKSPSATTSQEAQAENEK